MKPVQWRVPAGTDPRKFREALTLAHSAAQWLARLANSYLAPQPQHQQLLLAFDPQRHAFVSQVFINDLSVELRLPQIEMQFREGSHLVPHVLDVEGRSSAQIEAWVLVELLHRGIDRARFSKQLPYGAANLMSGDSLEYSPKACADGLAALSDWFGNAAIVLEKIAEASRMKV